MWKGTHYCYNFSQCLRKFTYQELLLFRALVLHSEWPCASRSEGPNHPWAFWGPPEGHAAPSPWHGAPAAPSAGCKHGLSSPKHEAGRRVSRHMSTGTREWEFRVTGADSRRRRLIWERSHGTCDRLTSCNAETCFWAEKMNASEDMAPLRRH